MGPFWTGRVDLDALAWEITALLDDLDVADRKVADATRHATSLWRAAYGGDELLVSVSGIGAVTAPVVRAYLGDAGQFADAKKAAALRRVDPSYLGVRADGVAVAADHQPRTS